MNKPDKWKTIDSKDIADCRVFSVRKDISKNEETNKTASFFVVDCPRWMNIIPITSNREVVLIEQFRHGIQEFTLEIPAGIVEYSEKPFETAQRELTEETGYVAGRIVKIGQTRPNPAIQNNWIHHFLATDCESTGKTNFDEHESITTRCVPFGEIPELITSGRITHSLVIAAFHIWMIGNNGDRYF